MAFTILNASLRTKRVFFRCRPVKSANNLERVDNRQKVTPEHEYETTIILSTDEVISRLERPLAAEIDISPL